MCRTRTTTATILGLTLWAAALAGCDRSGPTPPDAVAPNVEPDGPVVNVPPEI